MDKDRNDILNELIKYYDSEPADPAEEISTPADDSAQSDDIGHTRIVKTKAAPTEETLGNTITVNVTKPRQKKENAEQANGHTIEIPLSAEQTAVQNETDSEPQPKPEEILGNLDIFGKPIKSEPIDEPTAAELQADDKPEPAVNRRTRAPFIPEEDEEELTTKRRSGFWFATKPLWVTLMICTILVGIFEFWITNTGIIGTYKRNFNYNMGLIMNMFGAEWDPSGALPTVGKTDTEHKILAANETKKLEANDYTETNNEQTVQTSQHVSVGGNKSHIPFAEAGNAVFSEFDNGVVCAKSNYICFINKKGETQWSAVTEVSNPIISIRGKYIALASRGGTQVCLYKKSKLIYSINLPNPAKSCAVSENGDIVLITEKTAYKGSVILVNKKGDIAFTWSSGVNYITSAIPLKSRKIAVGLSDTQNAVNSYVMIFDIKSTDAQSGIELSDSLVYKLDTDGKNILINGDNCMSLMTQKSEIKYDNRYNESYITHSANDLHGNRVLTYTNNNLPIMELFNHKGIALDARAIESTPDFVDVYKSTVLYNSGRDIICGKAKDDTKTIYTAPMTIKKLMLLDASSYLVAYDDCIEIIRI